MTEAHTPELELIYGGSGPEARAAIVGDAKNMVRILVDCRRNFTDPGPLASLIVLAVNSHARLVAALEDCPLPSQSAPAGEFYGRFYAWYNGQREAALKSKD